AQITQWIAAEGGNGQLKEERALLQHSLDDVAAIVTTMINDLGSAVPPSDARNVYKVGLNTTRLLMVLGDVICAWLLLRGAEVALNRLNEELRPGEKAFYEGKVASGRWFARTVLPKLAAERAIAEATDLAVMDLDEAAF
ncbi:MAG TPA: acyl-CoA dehydrogenase C-terminal domain-containing protein, partial [Propionibacteriaceae bacterium]|nr:acyl-CoA dehydrogenase C-terminal domain-containing protein [Propionibacteriaceae bacterium]